MKGVEVLVVVVVVVVVGDWYWAPEVVCGVLL